MSEPKSAKPRYSIGQTVRYTDRHGRLQSGEVRHIEATWNPWTGNGAPLIIYSLYHPTYTNHNFYTTDERIISSAPTAGEQG